MIHPMEAPIFGDMKRTDSLEVPDPDRKVQRRHSWAMPELEELPSIAVPRGPQVNTEMAYVLWGRMFQSVGKVTTLEDAINVLADKAAEELSLDSSNPSKSRRKISDNIKLVPLKLVEAHMTDQSADKICACVGHHRENVPSTDDQPNTLLLRRDESYDLELSFDRDVQLDADRIEIALEEEQRFGLPATNIVGFPVTSAPPDPVQKATAYKNWWAAHIGLGDKKATIRLHVSNSARVGKWRMKVLTSMNYEVEPSKKRERDMAVAFHRLHIAMNPEQMGQKKSIDRRRLAKLSFNSKEA